MPGAPTRSAARTGVADEVLSIFLKRGTSAYFGERVSMTEHSLQTAYFAQMEAAPPVLVVAALLHDIGHLIAAVPDDIADWSSDAHHEKLGSQWIAQRFAAEVAEPVRLHVAAKRYLCATDDAYLARLSSASIATLKLQGGAMAPDEITQFESERFFRDAVRLRLWDDQGKVAGLSTPALADFRDLIDAFAPFP
jgi:phosphonate degradation associated HDIG domain protein